MKTSHEAHRPDAPPHATRTAPPAPIYTPTPDGFERCMRRWVGLPADDVAAPETGDAHARLREPGAREQA